MSLTKTKWPDSGRRRSASVDPADGAEAEAAICPTNSTGLESPQIQGLASIFILQFNVNDLNVNQDFLEEVLCFRENLVCICD